MRVLAERGYIIPAVNTDNTDYVMCARQLVRSLKAFHPEAKVCLLTDTMIEDEYFDYIHLLPQGDQDPNSNWKLNNDWQVFGASPFRETIKLEADMWVTSPIDHWWTLFEKRDVVISQGCRNFYDQPATSRYYRKIFDDNNLPDVYNGITYWRLSQTAKEFFNLVRELFENWNEHKRLLKFPDDIPTTDVVYGMAAVIMGPEKLTLPVGYGPTMVHMKKHIIGTLTDNWSDELVFEHTNPGLRINTVAQWGLVHYHIKDLNNE